MTNFKKFLLIISFLSILVGCEKESGLSVEQNTPFNDTIQNPIQALPAYSGEPGVEPLRKMYLDHMKYHATVEPWEFLPEPIRQVFKDKYMEERTLMDALGNDAYLDQKVADGTISYDFGQAMKTLRNTINAVPISEENAGSLTQTLEDQRDALVLVQKEKTTAALVYDMVLATINELFSDDGVDFRADPCKLSDLIDDIITGAEIGATVG